MELLLGKKINCLFDNSAFQPSEITLPTNKAIPVNPALKAKLSSHSGLGKLKNRGY